MATQEHPLGTEIDVARPLQPAGATITELMTRWDVAAFELRHVRNGANSVYQFDSGPSRYFMRVTHDSHRSQMQIEAELEFVRFVRQRGVDAAAPVRSNNDAWVETVQDHAGNTWHAVVFTAVPGRQFQFFSPDISEPLFRAWGSAMGALHVASRAFVPLASRCRPSWSQQDSTACDRRRLPPWEEAALREHDRISAWLDSLDATPERWGLIHGDFERTNFSWDERSIHVFDFDDVCYHWYVADVAHALWAFRRAPAEERARFLRWFIAGYGEHSQIAASVSEQLSWFIRLRTLSLFVQRLTREATSEGSWLRMARSGFDTPYRW